MHKLMLISSINSQIHCVIWLINYNTFELAISNTILYVYLEKKILGTFNE